MNELKCPNCGNPIAGDQAFCPHCGARNGQYQPFTVIVNTPSKGEAAQDDKKVLVWIANNANYFPQSKVDFIRSKLSNINDTQFEILQNTTFRDPGPGSILRAFGLDPGHFSFVKLFTFSYGTLGLFAIPVYREDIKKENVNKLISLL